MTRLQLTRFVCGALALTLTLPAHAADYAAWIAAFKRDAVKEGIPPTVLEEAFADITEPNESVIRLDRKQPEGTMGFSDYLATTVNEKRIARGQELLAEHEELLAAIGRHYNVQPRFIIALWGIETSYGANKGNYSLIDALATLAYEGRRADFFRKELMNSLIILTAENIPPDELKGSWAGAMGNCQFMPSSYLQFAVDWDGDGKRDIWNSLPDTFASIANYLHQSGWDGTTGWGGPVATPDNFGEGETGLTAAKPLRAWAARGLTHANGESLPDDPREAYALFPGEPWEGAYLVSSNYKVLLRWNRSRYFATAVGTLADRIAEEG